jgi:uncharacterized coiled-coil DUF342 family protein
MQTNNKAILLAVFAMQILLLSGCSSDRKQANVAVHPDDPLAKYWNDAVAKRFQEPAPHGSTPADSAIELSEKYARLFEEAAALKQQNQDFSAKNQQLKEQTAAIETQLQQAQKELAEANDLLIEMRVELNNWKSNILGFREEMREAETAQLEALLRILKVLGGQVQVESAKGENTGPAVASVSNPNQP